MIPLTVPEVRRLLLTLAEPPERIRFRLAWSTFRRRHQARAKRSHQAQRARSHSPPHTSATVQALPPTLPDLTDAHWKQIAALLPPLAARGRPAQDHRQLVAGMLWVMRTGASWREMPDHFGPWHTVYTRYADWRRSGLWSQILEILVPQETLHVS